LLLAALGAKSVIEDEVQVENMRKFGSSSVWHSKLKMICLIIQRKLLKPTGIDIKEQKMTLPLIHVLNTCTAKKNHG
jgi:octaprenyl-diphosphate synthase